MPAAPKRIAAPFTDPEIGAVVKLILSGKNAFEFFDETQRQFPDRDTTALVMAAMDYFERQAEFVPDVVLGWCFEAARDLYRRMVEAEDYAGALRAVKQIAEMTKHVHRDGDEEAPSEEASQPAVGG